MVRVKNELKNSLILVVISPDRPSIKPVGADLKAGRVTADGARLGMESQGQIADGKL